MSNDNTIDGRIENERARALPSDIDLEPITSEDEDYESAPADYQISTYPADFTLEILHAKWKDKDILIPEFQRSFVWKQIQSSKLIESFLVGLPVPAVFFYTERKSQKYFVIDGQQRLKSIFYFLEGYFGSASDDLRKVFRLNGLSSLSRFAGKTFEELNEEDRRRLKNSVLRAFIVQQLDPEDDTSMYHIFERLNTGGTLLTNQEVRNCVYLGKLIAMIKRLNSLQDWRSILGKETVDSRQKDIELIVRFFALRDISGYQKPMKDHLSKYMRKNRNPQPEAISSGESLFTQTCARIIQKLGAKPFHVRAGLNAAVFDSVMVAVSKHVDNIPANLSTRFKALIADTAFDKATRTSTTDVENVRKRFSIAETILFG